MVDNFNESLTGMTSEVMEILAINIFTDDRYKTVGNLVKTIHSDVIIPLALYVMIIYFIIALVDKMSSENFTWEQLGRQFAMFFLAYGLMLHGMDLLMLLWNMGTELLDLVKAKMSEGTIPAPISSEMVEDYIENFTIFGLNIKFIAKILASVNLMIPEQLAKLLKIAAQVICYSRIIEIYVRATFAPIAFSDFFQNGFQGAGWNFLKSFAAVAVQGALIAVIALIFSRLSGAVFQTPDGSVNLFATVGKSLALSFAAMMLMFKSLSITKELFGVR